MDNIFENMSVTEYPSYSLYNPSDKLNRTARTVIEPLGLGPRAPNREVPYPSNPAKRGFLKRDPTLRWQSEMVTIKGF
jgi:hypothetical protein